MHPALITLSTDLTELEELPGCRVMGRDHISAIAQSRDLQKAFLAAIVQPLSLIQGDGCLVTQIMLPAIALDWSCKSGSFPFQADFV